MTRASDSGFTLIEALVAMAVLAMGAVSLLSATEGHTRRISDLTDRVAARWAADHALATLRVGLTPEPGSIEFHGILFDVTYERIATDDPDLEKLAVSVAKAGTNQPLYLLDGYLDVGEAP